MKKYEEYMKKVGDRNGLFNLLSINYPIKRALYPGSYVDITPSFYFPYTVYIDNDNKAKKFFKEGEMIKEYIDKNKEYTQDSFFRYFPNDYSLKIDEKENSFDLLISLYSGFVSKYCKNYLKNGGLLLANDSHGDASMAKLDNRFRLIGVINISGSNYEFSQKNLDQFFILKKHYVVTVKKLEEYQKGIDFTKKADFYLFKFEF
jgi:hypothetical protein